MSNNQTNEMSRLHVPETRRLQAHIIAEAANVTQITEPSFEPTKKLIRPKKCVCRFFQTSVVFSAFLVTTVTLIVQWGWVSVDPNLSTMPVANDDLDWHEIMMLEDEWLLVTL